MLENRPVKCAVVSHCEVRVAFHIMLLIVAISCMFEFIFGSSWAISIDIRDDIETNKWAESVFIQPISRGLAGAKWPNPAICLSSEVNMIMYGMRLGCSYTQITHALQCAQHSNCRA